jgi:hypothetical protein
MYQSYKTLTGTLSFHYVTRLNMMKDIYDVTTKFLLLHSKVWLAQK